MPVTLIQALYGICHPTFPPFHICCKCFHSGISYYTLTHIKSAWTGTAKQLVPSLCFKTLNILQYLDWFFLQSPLGRAEQHPRAQRDKLLLSCLRLVLMQQKDSGSHKPASSSPPDPCRVQSLIPEYIKPSPTKDRSLKVRQSVLYAENYITESIRSPRPFLPMFPWLP